MKTSSLVSILMASALVVCAPLALANTVENPGQMTKVLEDLKSKGYDIVKKIEFNDDKNMYNAKVVNAEGKGMKLKIDAKSGEITKAKDAVEGITALEVAQKVQAAGYTSIQKIDTETFGNDYYVKALGKDNKVINLEVDAKSGKVSTRD